MADIQWISVIIGVGFGGLAGALLTNIVSAYRNRVQPISYRLRFFELHAHSRALESLGATVAIVENNQTFSIGNLWMAQLEITNSGNTDLDDFSFGASFSEPGCEALNVELESQSRHHAIGIDKEINFRNRQREMDFTLKPFNRGNTYAINILCSNHLDPAGSHGDLELSTASPVKFVRKYQDSIDALSVLELAATLAVKVVQGKF
ncbi:MAG TPA: hypothetical protein VGI80_01190 [Pyrinomonadaceae bacterium]|jgi:hypothetical protein